MKKQLSLGRDFSSYGQYNKTELGPEVATFISVGSDPTSPSLAYKADLENPNEDALFVATDENWLMLAIADAHYGAEASHTLLTRLSERCHKIPQSAGELALCILSLCSDPWETSSATTLLVSVIDRTTGAGFGYNWGDSSLVIVDESKVTTVNQQDEVYIGPDSIPDLGSAHFAFQLKPGDLLLAFSDGVNECHYRSPLTSVTHLHLAALCRPAFQRPEEMTAAGLGEQLMQLALSGVDGHPGGQDNIALVLVTPPR